MRAYTLSHEQELYQKFQIAYQLLACENEDKLIKKYWTKLKKYSSLRPIQLCEVIKQERLKGGQSAY